MDRDVEAKVEKLCAKYLVAQAKAVQLRPALLLTKRQTARAQGQLVNVLGQLREQRLPAGAALLRLAYVRGMRASHENARLGPQHEVELTFFENQLDKALGGSEASTLMDFRNHVRRLITSETMSRFGASPRLLEIIQDGEPPYPLEQRARASVLSIVQMASTAGALAGTHSDSYDGELIQ